MHSTPPNSRSISASCLALGLGTLAIAAALLGGCETASIQSNGAGTSTGCSGPFGPPLTQAQLAQLQPCCQQYGTSGHYIEVSRAAPAIASTVSQVFDKSPDGTRYCVPDQLLTSPGATGGASIFQSCTKSDGRSGLCVDQCIKSARPAMPDAQDFADSCPKPSPGQGTRCLADQQSMGPSARQIADMMLRCF